MNPAADPDGALDRGISLAVPLSLGRDFSDLYHAARQEAHLKVLRHLSRGRKIVNPFAFGWRAGIWASLSQIDKEKQHRDLRIDFRTPLSSEGDELAETEAGRLLFSDDGVAAATIEGELTVRQILVGMRQEL